MLAAMALRKAAERTQAEGRDDGALALAIHVEACRVCQLGDGPQIDPEGRGAAWSALEALTRLAGSGMILVSDAARRLLDRRFELAPQGAPGADSGRAFRLLGRERLEFGLGGRITTFVGRQEALDLLHASFGAVTRGQGAVVAVTGEPGIGKSRLIFEFRRRLPDGQAAYLEGRCLSYGASTPYLPLLDVLRSQCGIVVEGDRPATVVEKVLEHLHWIDPSSAEFLGRLMDGLAAAPILLLLSFRPEYHAPWLERSYTSRLGLSALSPEASATVMRSALQRDDLPEPVARAILARAEGNPSSSTR